MSSSPSEPVAPTENAPAPEVFRYLHLPDVPRKLAFRQIEPEEAILGTMSSDRFLRDAELFKILAKSVSFTYMKNSFMIHLDLYKKLIDICFGSVEPNPSNIRKINGTSMEMSVSRNGSFWRFPLTTETAHMATMETVLTHLMKILKVKSFYGFKFDLEDVSVRDLPFWKYNPSFENAQIKHGYQNGNAVVMSSEDVTFLLEEVNVKTLEMKVKAPDGFEYKKPLRCAKFTAHNDSWLTTECLMSPDLVAVRIDPSRASPRICYKAILNKWVNGGMEKLELFTATHCTEEDLLNGIETKPSFFTETDANRRSISIRDGGTNIQRKTDGRIATTIRDDELLEICVWHEKHYKFCTPPTFQALMKLKQEFERK